MFCSIPVKTHSLSTLHTVLSTGSPLKPTKSNLIQTRYADDEEDDESDSDEDEVDGDEEDEDDDDHDGKREEKAEVSQNLSQLKVQES